MSVKDAQSNLEQRNGAGKSMLPENEEVQRGKLVP